MTESIEKIRKDVIEEIKEKIRNNPKFLHPANKERLEYQEKLKFANGNDFVNWMQQVGIMKNPVNIKSDELKKTIENSGCKTFTEYRDKCAQRLGFKDNAEKAKEWAHETGRCFPQEDNLDCSKYFGEFISQNYVMKTFEDPIEMPPNNPGFDWICKRGEKIDHKGACLTYPSRGPPRWAFDIDHNNIAEWFILSAWDNRDSLNPLHVWAFYKDDIVRGRKFCEFDGFSISNTPEKLKELEKWEVTARLDKLKELCKQKKN